MKKRYEKYCPGCGKAYESDTPDSRTEKNADYEYEHDQINEINVIDAEYEQGVADAEANEEPRPFKQIQGKKWTGEKDYMNDYIPPIDIKDIGKE